MHSIVVTELHKVQIGLYSQWEKFSFFEGDLVDTPKELRRDTFDCFYQRTVDQLSVTIQCMGSHRSCMHHEMKALPVHHGARPASLEERLIAELGSLLMLLWHSSYVNHCSSCWREFASLKEESCAVQE